MQIATDAKGFYRYTRTTGERVSFRVVERRAWAFIVEYWIDGEPGGPLGPYPTWERAEHAIGDWIDMDVIDTDMPDESSKCPDCGTVVALRAVCPTCFPARRDARQISCGCCTDGCVCVNHMDIPRGIRPQICAEHGGPRFIHV